MAVCGFSSLARHGSCGASKFNPTNIKCVSVGNCKKDIKGHLKTFKTSDSLLQTEADLLLARAGKRLYYILTSFCIVHWIVNDSIYIVGAISYHYKDHSWVFVKIMQCFRYGTAIILYTMWKGVPNSILSATVPFKLYIRNGDNDDRVQRRRKWKRKGREGNVNAASRDKEPEGEPAWL